MKRIIALLICFFILGSATAIPATAESPESQQIVVKQTVEDLGNGLLYVETIYIPAVQTFSSAKTGTKVAQCINGSTTIYTISVTGTFTYDGTTSDATSSTCNMATYVESAKILDCYSYTSGPSACAFGSVSYNGATLQKTVTLTCDKDGNLS